MGKARFRVGSEDVEQTDDRERGGRFWEFAHGKE